MRRLQINFSNRAIYTLVAVGIFIIAIWGVWAFGGNQPEVMGHSVDELDLGPLEINPIGAINIERGGKILHFDPRNQGTDSFSQIKTDQGMGLKLVVNSIAGSGGTNAIDISSSGNIITAGNIQASGDVCTGSGNCLNSVGGTVDWSNCEICLRCGSPHQGYDTECVDFNDGWSEVARKSDSTAWNNGCAVKVTCS